LKGFWFEGWMVGTALFRENMNLSMISFKAFLIFALLFFKKGNWLARFHSRRESMFIDIERTELPKSRRDFM
jgi:hypothetical protein